MIKELIELLKKEQIVNEEVLQKYLQNQEIIKKISELENEKLNIIKKIEQLKANSNFNNFFQKIFNNKVNKEIRTLKTKIKNIEQLIEKENQELKKYYLNEEEINKIENYEKILGIEKSYDSNQYKDVVIYLMQKFDNDYKKIINYCITNGIVLDYSNEKEEEILEEFMQYKIKNIKMKDKISSLEDMFLVRRTDIVPENDQVEAPLKKATEQKKFELYVNNKNYEIDVKLPKGHYTVHFAINKEVSAHKDADVWKNMKITIIQPFTEELYESALAVEALDTFFAKKVKLNNFFAICDNLETAKQIIQKNTTAIPIITPKGKVNKFGNKLLFTMNITYPYIDYQGQWLDGTVPLENYYTQEFAEKYPKFVDEKFARIYATSHPVHIFASDIPGIVCDLELVDKFAELVDKNNSFNQVIKMVLNYFVENGKMFSFDLYTKKRNNFSYTEFLPDKYNEYGDFLNYITETEILEPQSIFERMKNGLEISQTNLEQLKIIKEQIIKIVNDYNITKEKQQHYEEEKYKETINKLFVLYKLIRTEAINLSVDKSNREDIALEWYNVKMIEDNISYILDTMVENGMNMDDSWLQLRDGMFDGSIKIPELEITLEKPESIDLLFRIQNLIDNYLVEDVSDQFIISELNEYKRMIENNKMIANYNINECILYVLTLEKKQKLKLNQHHNI